MYGSMTRQFISTEIWLRAIQKRVVKLEFDEGERERLQTNKERYREMERRMQKDTKT